MVGVSASFNLPLHHKVQKFSSSTGSPWWSRKKGHKTVVVMILTGSIIQHYIISKLTTLCNSSRQSDKTSTSLPLSYGIRFAKFQQCRNSFRSSLKMRSFCKKQSTFTCICLSHMALKSAKNRASRFSYFKVWAVGHTGPSFSCYPVHQSRSTCICYNTIVRIRQYLI